MFTLAARGQVYDWKDQRLPASHAYVRPALEALLASTERPAKARVLDFGCGNGVTSRWLSEKDFDVVGLDLSETGIAMARAASPELTFSTDLSRENVSRLGPFDLALCIEVIAHCHEPGAELRKIFEALKPGGTLILATPYYGYLKVLLLALTGRLKHHQSVAAYANYVSLFTPESVTRLLKEAGFTGVEIVRVGRIAPLARDMFVRARRP